MPNFHFFSVNLAVIVRNVTSQQYSMWDITLGTISAKFAEKRRKLSTEKLTCKRTHVREMSMDRQESSKLVVVG